MSSREQFESWYLDNWGHTEDHHETLFERSPDDESEYYRCGVRIAHQAWQAATSAMEAKCAALAAENAGLKECTINHAPAVEHWNAWADAEDKIPAVPETPATDAFLAEARAQGVDAAIEHLHMIFDGTDHIGEPLKALEWLAQVIRKGAAQ